MTVNFRYERYIPFEGAGAISKWRLELPDTFREFGYDSITDVVMHFVTRLLMEETKWLF